MEVTPEHRFDPLSTPGHRRPFREPGGRHGDGPARWTAQFGLSEWSVTIRTLRRRLFSLAGRLTHSANQPSGPVLIPRYGSHTASESPACAENTRLPSLPRPTPPHSKLDLL